MTNKLKGQNDIEKKETSWESTQFSISNNIQSNQILWTMEIDVEYLVNVSVSVHVMFWLNESKD